MEKLVITIAPTGNVPTKELNPASPVTPKEIAEDVKKCQALGATVAHLHARNKAQEPTHSRSVYKAILDEIKKEDIDIITVLSTGARGGPNTIESRCQMLDLDCDFASIAPGSSNFATSVNANDPELVNAMAKKMHDNGIKPEVEVFDMAFLDNAKKLIKKGILIPPVHFTLAFGIPGSLGASPKALMYLVESLPPKSTWSVVACAQHQVPLLTMAIILGGHVRTGLEDTILYEKGVLATNPMLVERVVRIAKEMKREIATPDEARKLLNLK